MGLAVLWCPLCARHCTRLTCLIISADIVRALHSTHGLIVQIRKLRGLRELTLVYTGRTSQSQHIILLMTPLTPHLWKAWLMSLAHFRLMWKGLRSRQAKDALCLYRPSVSSSALAVPVCSRGLATPLAHRPSPFTVPKIKITYTRLNSKKEKEDGGKKLKTFFPELTRGFLKFFWPEN